MQPIAYFYPNGHEAHMQEGHPERPDRAEEVKRALVENDLWNIGKLLPPLKLEDGVYKSIHSQSHLERLQQLSAAGQDYDAETYLTNATWQLALNAAGGGAAVALAVWRQEAQAGFALTRPPGHHATPDAAMGFCLINNIALAAEFLIKQEGAKRLAIIDIDVHHGNGTQEIFWRRNDVFFFSTHQSPLYPGTGQLSERGEQDGQGFTCNIPLPPYSRDRAFDSAYEDVVLPLLNSYQPEMLLISFGFDAHWKDPLAQLEISADAYARQIKRLSDWADQNCQGRIALFLEGGYDLEVAYACGLAVTQALLGQEWNDLLSPSPSIESNHWKAVITKAKEIWRI